MADGSEGVYSMSRVKTENHVTLINMVTKTTKRELKFLYFSPSWFGETDSLEHRDVAVCFGEVEL